jgi:hypothetical protein
MENTGMKLSGRAYVPSAGLKAQPAILHYSVLSESGLLGAFFRFLRMQRLRSESQTRG